MQDNDVIGRLNIVQADVSCPSGAVSKTSFDRNGNEVFTDGSVRYLDRKLLRPFTKARQACARACLLHGTRFLGGYAIPDDSLAEVRGKLDQIARDFAAEKAVFAGTLHAHREDWEGVHSEIVAYKGRFPTDSDVISGIGMYASVYKVIPGDSGDATDGISHGVDGLAGQILREVAQDVKDTFNPDVAKASSRAKNVLLRAKTKLESLGFVDASLTPVTRMIEATLAALPATGSLEDRDFTIYAGLCGTLMDPESVRKVAAAMSITDKDSAWAAFSPESATPAPIEDAFNVDAAPSVASTTPVADSNVPPITAPEPPAHATPEAPDAFASDMTPPEEFFPVQPQATVPTPDDAVSPVSADNVPDDIAVDDEDLVLPPAHSSEDTTDAANWQW